MTYWVRYHLRYLRMWREAARAVAEAVKSLGLRARVYVIGSIAEGKHTVLSDVDVLVCLEEEVPDPRRVKHMILEEAFDRHGLPLYYPIDLHVAGPGECREILSRGRHVRIY